MPTEISKALIKTSEPLLANLVPILAVPEFKVPLPGGGRASQNDVFVLARSSVGPVCIMVEGKVNESFGPTLKEWQNDASRGKGHRLKFLLQTLCIPKISEGHVRYQFLHRAASAIVTGEQYHASAAIVLIHSFSERRSGWKDYEAFFCLFGKQAVCNEVQHLTSITSIPLFSAWVAGNQAFLKC